MLAVQVLTSEKRANQLSPGGPHAYKNGHVMMNFGSDVIYLLHTHTRMNVCMCILIQMGANLSFSCYGFLANNFVFSHVDITIHRWFMPSYFVFCNVWKFISHHTGFPLCFIL